MLVLRRINIITLPQHTNIARYKYQAGVLPGNFTIVQLLVIFQSFRYGLI